MKKYILICSFIISTSFASILEPLLQGEARVTLEDKSATYNLIGRLDNDLSVYVEIQNDAKTSLANCTYKATKKVYSNLAKVENRIIYLANQQCNYTSEKIKSSMTFMEKAVLSFVIEEGPTPYLQALVGHQPIKLIAKKINLNKIDQHLKKQ